MIKDLLRAVNIVPRPSFYLGRGANGDLNAKHLKVIYETLLNVKGKKIAANFLDLVESIPCLSASDFITALFAFEVNNFLPIENGIEFEKDSEGNYNLLSVSIAAMEIFMPKIDNTKFIKYNFFISVGDFERAKDCLLITENDNEKNAYLQ